MQIGGVPKGGGDTSLGVEGGCSPLGVLSLMKVIVHSNGHRAAAFDVTGRKTSATLSVIFRFAHKTARQEIVSSTVILEMQAAWNLPSTTVSTFAVAQLPC